MNSIAKITKWKKEVMVASVLVALGTAASAGIVTFTDDFDALTPGTSSLGAASADWTTGGSGTEVGLATAGTSGSVYVTNNQYNTYYVTWLDGVDVASKAFTFNVDTSAGSSSVYGGLCWNVQDKNNYYCMRWTAGSLMQVIEVKNGVDNAVPINSSAYYWDGTTKTVTVTSDGAGYYTLDFGGIGAFSFTDTTPLTGGSLGLYVKAGGAGTTGTFHFDNFSSVVVPEPAALSILLLGTVAWAGRRRQSLR